MREAQANLTNVAEVAARLRSRFGAAWRSLEPLYCLADFCYAVRRAVVDAVRRTADYMSMRWHGALQGHANRPGSIETDARAMAAAATYFDDVAG